MKEDLDLLVELGREIPDSDKREQHFEAVMRLAEAANVTLKINEENSGEENVDEPEQQDEDEAERQREEEEQKRRKHEEEVRRKKKLEEEAKEKAKKKAEEERRMKEMKEQEEERKRAEEERKKEEFSRRASFRKSVNLGAKSTGNTLEDVQARIPKVTPRGADLTDPEIAQTYVDVRDDNHPSDWMLLGYGDSNNKLQLYGSGSGGFGEFSKKIVEEPLFAYMRYNYGDTGRAKFILISYVPDKLNGLKKARIAGHKPDVAAFLKYFHIEVNALSKDDISQRNIEAKLKSAGGADYGSGRGGGTSGGENFSGIKANAANFYANKDKETELKGIVFQKGPLSTTPIDLSGRATVASATEARKNTIDLNIKRS